MPRHWRTGYHIHSRRLPWLAMRPLLAVLVLSLAACTTASNMEDCVCPLPTVPPLHLPAVQPVTTLTFVLQTNPARLIPALQGIAAYAGPPLPPSTTQPAHTLLNISRTLYAFDLPTQSVQPVTSDVVCQGLALSPDHRWLACPTGETFEGPCPDPCAFGSLLLAFLSPDWPPVVHMQQRIIAPIDGGTIRKYSSPTWSADGRHLAVVEPLATSDLTLFARGEGAAPLAVSGYVKLAGVITPSLKQVVWSPDGQYLALLIGPVAGVSTATQVAVVPLGALPPAVLSDTAHPPTVTMTPEVLVVPSSAASWLAWTPDSRALTLQDALVQQGQVQQEQLEQVAVPSGVVDAPFLRFPTDQAAAVGPFAWLGDGRSLLFSYGPGEGGRAARSESAIAALALARPHPQAACACGFPPAVVYLYTAP